MTKNNYIFFSSQLYVAQLQKHTLFMYWIYIKVDITKSLQIYILLDGAELKLDFRMDLNLKKIDEDLNDEQNPARRLLSTGAVEPITATTEDEKLNDIAIAEAVADIEKELKAQSKQLPDYIWYNVAFVILVVGFWLKYFKVV